MEVIPVSETAIERAVQALEKGKVVIHATETCYGIACDLTNPEAVTRLFKVKKRPTDQPVSALFSSIASAEQCVVFSDRALELAKKYLPGPLTIVLPVRTDTPFNIHVCPPPFSIVHFPLCISLGVRLSSHPVAQALTERFGKPIATTSANLHGQPSPYVIEEIVQQFEGQTPIPDLILESGLLTHRAPSTVVEVIGDRLRVLRQGDIVLR